MSQSGGFSSTALRLSEEKCRDFWQKYELLFPVGTGTVSCVFRTLSVFVWQPRQASKHLEGTYGVVYKARNRDNGRLVAIKQSKKQPGASREEREAKAAEQKAREAQAAAEDDFKKAQQEVERAQAKAEQSQKEKKLASEQESIKRQALADAQRAWEEIERKTNQTQEGHIKETGLKDNINKNNRYDKLHICHIMFKQI